MSDEKVVPHKTHWFVVILVCVATFFITRYMSVQENDKYRKALEDTITARLEKIGTATQMQGNVVNYDELENRLRNSLGADLQRQLDRTNGTIQSVTNAIGEVKYQLANLKTPPTGERKDDGSFTTTLEQNRNNLPSLTSLSLSYDAKKPGLTGLNGTWNNYSEVFNISHAEWRTSDDGLRAAARLKRTIYRDANKTQKVGEEEINIENADAYFSKENVEHMAPYPAYSVFVGSSFDKDTGRKHLAFYFDTRVTKRVGVTTGYVNQGYFLGTSFTFGKK